MSKATVGNRGSRTRFSGPWTPNPWILRPTVGPRNRQHVDGSARGPALSGAVLSGEAHAAPTSAVVVATYAGEEKKQSKKALSTWEGEGGAPVATRERPRGRRP